jgi:uncharacterized Fe-S cluster protein YjdI
MSNKVTKAELSEFRKDKDNVKEFTNGEITVFWKADLCIHSANCLMGMPRVFNTKRKPWIVLTGADSKEIMKTIDTCPSRALTFLKSTSFTVRKPRKKKKLAPKFAKVQILKDGPMLVTGNFIIRDSKKKKVRVESPVAALCRCGGSKKKPFCDGSHLAQGFKD